MMNKVGFGNSTPLKDIVPIDTTKESEPVKNSEKIEAPKEKEEIKVAFTIIDGKVVPVAKK